MLNHTTRIFVQLCKAKDNELDPPGKENYARSPEKIGSMGVEGEVRAEGKEEGIWDGRDGRRTGMESKERES